MKKKKINEFVTNTSSTTATGASTSSTSSTNPNAGVNINLKKKDLSDPAVQKNLSTMKGTNVTVVDEEVDMYKDKSKLSYLSEIKDENGELSKPFSIDGSEYQIVRAITPDGEKTIGIYCLDKKDATGEDMIYGVEEFEKMMQKEEPKEEEKITTDKPESKDDKNFVGFKHYIVNKKTGKARKFKDIAELAKAKMGEDEVYMGIKDFKKHVDEMLFGSKKRVEEDDTQSNQNTQTPQNNQQSQSNPNEGNIVVNAQKLMELLKPRIPSNVMIQVKNNQLAQREIIAEFGELLGVKRTDLVQLFTTVKDLGATQPQQNTQPPQNNQSNNVSEGIQRKVINTIKVKDIK